MNNKNDLEGVDADILAQFLRECEPPTPPSAPSAFVASLGVFFTPNISRPSAGSPHSFNSMLEFEDVDKRAILEAIDSYSTPAEVHLANAKLLQGGFDVGTLRTAKLNEKEEEQARKLASQRAKATKRRNRHRQRVKAEWDALRLQDSELTEQLAALKRARLGEVIPLKWQARASQELSARIQAEAQQQNVRRAIEHRAAVMQKLQEVIDSNNHSSGDDQAYEWKPADFKLYRNFMLEVGAAYARTDAVLHHCGLSEEVLSSTSFYKPVRRKDALQGVDFFESTSAFVLPSKYPKAANAMFDSMRQVHLQGPNRRLFETVDDLPNTIAVKLGTTFHWREGKVVPLNMVLVMHRFVEPGRTVLVWRSLIEGDGDFAGTFLDSTGWCVLRPADTGALNSTDVRTCIHLIPTQLHRQKQIEESANTTDVEEFTEAVVRSSQKDKLELARLMQELLLDSK